MSGHDDIADAVATVPDDAPDPPPRYGLAEVLANTARFYALTAHGIPVLKPFVKPCSCGANEWVPRAWRWHRREHSTTTPFRCDVAVKCAGCAVLLGHGVALPREWWDARPDYEEKSRIAYHELPAEMRAEIDRLSRHPAWPARSDRPGLPDTGPIGAA